MLDIGTKENVEKLKEYEDPFHVFYDLMPNRVKEILLVSSLYDQFVLTEEGSLMEGLFAAYQQLRLSPPPRITRASTVEEALKLLKERYFDLVITMRRLGDVNPFIFGQKVKNIMPDCPVVLLLNNYSDLAHLPRLSQMKGVDYSFVWTGDASLFLAIIKLIEDEKNVHNDTKAGLVRVIIVVEDTIQYYSTFLPLMYKELMTLTQKLIGEELNDNQRLLRRRIRPKILLARTYEEAKKYFDKYEEYLIGILTDMTFPKTAADNKDPHAGIQLINYVKSKRPNLPILLHSTDIKNEKTAHALNVKFLYKKSQRWLYDLRKYLETYFGFGDFVFRSPTGELLDKVSSLTKLEKVLKRIPATSIKYHLESGDLINWLVVRGEYQLASHLRLLKSFKIPDDEELKSLVINLFKERQTNLQKMIIVEFDKEHFSPQQKFVRIGKGSLGGKGRGIAFIRYLLSVYRDLHKKYHSIRIDIPNTIVLTTEYFDKFLEFNNLHEIALSDIEDEELTTIFLSKPLPPELVEILKIIIQQITYPIAVRSSSLLEDSQFQPFAGIYTTYLLPNNHPDVKIRLKQLETAIKLVYASTFKKLAKSYIKAIGQNIEIEKMAVIIQKIVGKKYGDRFYPDFSGVAQSYNYYPISYMKPEDGIVHVALGLGMMIVTGGKVLSFSPKHPLILPQMSTPDDALKNSQNEFYAVDLSQQHLKLTEGETATLKKLTLDVALKDGTLRWIGSVFDPQNQRIIDNVLIPGIPLVTFAPILKHRRFPLSELMLDLLKIGEESFGSPVEIEFAVLLDRTEREKHEFHILQIRPLTSENDRAEIETDSYKNQAIAYSTKVLGNGVFSDIYDIVYVKPDTFDNARTLEIKEEISRMNSLLCAKNREYILIGPGRWGTRDPFLGIPVQWNDISCAKAIVEVGLKNFQIEPSQGMHFFVNVTTLQRGYFTIQYGDKEDFIDWKWLNSQNAVYETLFIRHIQLESPITIRINGKTGKGVIVKPDTT